MRVPLSWLGDWCRLDGLTATDIADHLTNAGLEVEAIETDAHDTVLTLNITPNRGDCLSLLGVANELTAIVGRCRHDAPTGPAVAASLKLADLGVAVESPEACPLYTARRIGGVRIAPSPANVQARLIAAGLRPINNVVDATNYVMLELGQPLHAFDARTVQGGQLTIRAAQSAGSFTTLDGVARILAPGDLLICDSKNPIALAGIMGGQNSEVRDDTTDLIIESAYFSPATVRRTAKRLGLSSESLRRFERGVDPQRVPVALERVCQLIAEWAGGTVSPNWVAVQSPHLPQPLRIACTSAQVTRVLGLDLSTAEIGGFLERLGCQVEHSGTSLVVVVPTSRPDLTRPIDLIEDIARLYGYHRIPARAPRVPLHVAEYPASFAARAQVRHQLQAWGFTETVHYAFVPKITHDRFPLPGVAPEVVTNPLGEEAVVLKTTLLPGLVDCAVHNVRQGEADVRVFELRPVSRAGQTEQSSPRGRRPTEHDPVDRAAGRDSKWSQQGGMFGELMVAGLLLGSWTVANWQQRATAPDLFRWKGMLEQLCALLGVTCTVTTDTLPSFLHPGRAGWLQLQGERVGYFGELHPQLVAQYDLPSAPLIFECNLDRLRHFAKKMPIFQGLVRHPGIRRDVALLVDRTATAGAVQRAIEGTREPWVWSVQLFDLYEGAKIPAGKKSLAYAIYYRDSERTLTDEEVNVAHRRVVAKVTEELGASVR